MRTDRFVALRAVLPGRWAAGRAPSALIITIDVRDSLPEAQCLQLKAEPFHAGSWRAAPGRRGTVWRSARLPLSFEGLDDDHAAATAGAWRAEVVQFVRGIIVGRCGDVQEFTSKGEAGLASRVG